MVRGVATSAGRQRDELLAVLEDRFSSHVGRHEGTSWDSVLRRLGRSAVALEALFAMEQSGGEPDVVGLPGESGELLFVDCSLESPAGRRGLCYDEAALASRRQGGPRGSALGVAAVMGVELLTEDRYRALQELGEFDCKTSSWVQTPDAIRERGGALFCDRRYGHVFTYHNGAESYYAARGFRGLLRI